MSAGDPVTGDSAERQPHAYPALTDVDGHTATSGNCRSSFARRAPPQRAEARATPRSRRNSVDDRNDGIIGLSLLHAAHGDAVVDVVGRAHQQIGDVLGATAPAAMP